MPPLIHKFFSIPENFWKTEGFFYKAFRFGPLRQKIFDEKLWYSLLCIKFFDTPSSLKHWRDAHEIFRHYETKIFRRKLVIPPIMHKIFRYPRFSETLKGFPRNFSALWDKKFRRKLVIPLLCIKISRYPKTSETLKGCPRNFSALWDKIFDENLWYPHLCIKFFDTQVSWNIEGMPTKFFGNVRHKNFYWRSWYARSYP